MKVLSRSYEYIISYLYVLEISADKANIVVVLDFI